ncbi:OmpA family protein [Sulfobacillus thermosulfidooxidans]|uniref:OmpA family protein n=1 Tax=Sulfobacillus thermosulfidooxidans TaxID=28034 RepID=UPI001FA7B591|nr:OmpA family protein [Sulfobacillus thermosulfidooxidans]
MAGLVMMFILFLAASVLTYHHLLQQKEARINALLGVQTAIVHSLEQEFQKSHLHMTINPKTGDIQFASDVFFAFNSYKVSPAGVKSLKSFIPAYISVLLSPKYRQDISAIVVEGYTDRQGSYLYNLNLSQERALAVVNTIFSPAVGPFPYQEELQKYITAEGRSYNDPVYIHGRYSASASRRVVFSFKLNDTQIMDAVQSTVNGP